MAPYSLPRICAADSMDPSDAGQPTKPDGSSDWAFWVWFPSTDHTFCDDLVNSSQSFIPNAQVFPPNCSINRPNHNSETPRGKDADKYFYKYLINRKTMCKAYYRFNIYIGTCTSSPNTLGAQILKVSEDQSIWMAKSSHNHHLQFPLTSVEDFVLAISEWDWKLS